MPSHKTQPRLKSFAPQFLVDDLARSMSFYQKLGFKFGEPWDGFYAIGELDGLELHLKEAPKSGAERQHRREHEHLDAAAGVDGIEAFYERCVANGVTIFRPLNATAWGTKDFYVEDPDGYIIAFGGQPSETEALQPDMRQTIAHVALVVRDYDEAIDFYCRILHFTLIEDSYQPEQDKRWVVVAPPNSQGTTLLLARASTPGQQAFVGNQAGGRVFLFLSTDDFWRDYNDMLAAGVRFVREPKEAPYGTVAVFEDLYGNLWDLVQTARKDT